jgi:hypothetical protein
MAPATAVGSIPQWRPDVQQAEKLPASEARDDCDSFDEEPIARPRPSRNFVKRYVNWAGTRSIIFQSLFLGWTIFATFIGFALVLPTILKEPHTQSAQDAQAIAFGSGLCCSIGFYALLAVPLGIAAIATLETRRRE